MCHQNILEKITDNGLFKLHYKATTIILVTFVVLLAARSSDSISCIVKKEMSSKTIEKELRKKRKIYYCVHWSVQVTIAVVGGSLTLCGILLIHFAN